MARSGLSAIAVALFGLLAGGCETDSDYLAATGGRIEYYSVMCPMAVCAGQNGPDWVRLEAAPPKADIYLQHASILADDGDRDAKETYTWYARKPGEVMLCRSGDVNAFWRFREKGGEVIVAESYAWGYVTVIVKRC